MDNWTCSYNLQPQVTLPKLTSCLVMFYKQNITLDDFVVFNGSPPIEVFCWGKIPTSCMSLSYNMWISAMLPRILLTIVHLRKFPRCWYTGGVHTSVFFLTCLNLTDKITVSDDFVNRLRFCIRCCSPSALLQVDNLSLSLDRMLFLLSFFFFFFSGGEGVIFKFSFMHVICTAIVLCNS